MRSSSRRTRPARFDRLVLERLGERLVLSGNPDSSFGGVGFVSIDAQQLGDGVELRAGAVAVQADGKTVVAGIAKNGDGGVHWTSDKVPRGLSLLVARYNADGSLDQAFGSERRGFSAYQVLGDKGSWFFGVQPSPYWSFMTSVSCISVDAQGRILVGGTYWHDQYDGSATDFGARRGIVLRISKEGILDASFGNGRGGTGNDGQPGTSRFIVGDGDTAVSSIVQDPRNGKCLVFGSVYGNVFNGVSNSDMMVARLNANGTNDGSFGDHGGDGYRAIGLGTDESAVAGGIDLRGGIAANPFYGSIYVVGTTPVGPSGGPTNAVMARLTPSGGFDSRFGGRAHGGYDGIGRRFVPGVARPSGVAQLNDGSFVVVGSAYTAGNASSSVILQHLSGSGDLAGFPGSSAGATSVITPLGALGNFIDTHGVVTNKDGELVVLGVARQQDDSKNGNLVALEYKTTGQIDTAFASRGIANLRAVRVTDSAPSVAYGPGRRLVAAMGDSFEAGRFLDVGANLVAVNALVQDGYEGGPNPVVLVVSRSERLPLPTRVYLTIGGDASSPLNTFPQRFADFTGVVAKPGSPGPSAGGTDVCYVDIPANQTYASLTIRPVDDAYAEPDELVTFGVSPSVAYDVGAPAFASFTIHDNDGTATLLPTADAFVASDNRNSNFGDQGALYSLQGNSGAIPSFISFIKYDISSLSGITGSIQNVQLRLYGSLHNTGPSQQVSVYRSADTSWGEHQITWANKPATTGVRLGRTTVTGAGDAIRWYTWDVTTFVKSELAAGRTSITLVVRNDAPSADYVLFTSRENINAPQLYARQRS